jgi:hypothetical protein
MRIVKSTRAAAATAVVTMAIAPVALAAGNVALDSAAQT